MRVYVRAGVWGGRGGGAVYARVGDGDVCRTCEGVCSPSSSPTTEEVEGSGRLNREHLLQRVPRLCQALPMLASHRGAHHAEKGWRGALIHKTAARVSIFPSGKQVVYSPAVFYEFI